MRSSLNKMKIIKRKSSLFLTKLNKLFLVIVLFILYSKLILQKRLFESLTATKIIIMISVPWIHYVLFFISVQPMTDPNQTDPS